MGAFPLTNQVFTIFNALIQGRAGLHYAPEQRELLAEKLTGPASEAGFHNLLDYYYYLRYDAEGTVQLDRLIDSLLVHETYFFREVEALQALVDRVLLPKIKAGQKPRVWCAACASGEEPLTIAMLLAHHQALGQAQIVATDLSQKILERARRGRYGPRALRVASQAHTEQWFSREGDQVLVRSELREAIDWRHLNLIDASAIEQLGLFDAVICRNVLIYFNDETTKAVVRSLGNALKPDGVLLVGASESLIRLEAPFDIEEQAGAFFYRRRE
jgi:chemotaxis protein methyltransferase CheR